MPRLRVLAGPSVDELVEVSVNSGTAVDVKSDIFEGQVAVYLKDFVDPSGAISDSSYFNKAERMGVTWSIQMQGRFLQPYSTNDVLFGNTFEKPLNLPWGFNTALRFMQYIDPTLEQDLASQSKPWALSPLISTMPYLEHRRIAHDAEVPPFPPETPTANDTSLLYSSGDRRVYFRDVEHRKEVTLGPEDLIIADFCYNYVSFGPSGVGVSLPGGFSLDLTSYWDGEPVRFVCCERSSEDGLPWGRTFWCVVFEREDEEEEGSAEESEEGEEDAEGADDQSIGDDVD
ncbi:DUF1769-domain-containing protein [Sparassis latifolia]